jgi:hypothetical protein
VDETNAVRGTWEVDETNEARVVEVLLDTAHDSESLVVLVFAYPNGGRSRIQLGGAAVRDLVTLLELDDVGGLVGRPFSAIAPALPANR